MRKLEIELTHTDMEVIFKSTTETLVVPYSDFAAIVECATTKGGLLPLVAKETFTGKEHVWALVNTEDIAFITPCSNQQ